MGNALSASLTESEQQRVDAAAFMHQKLDPRGTADLVMIIVISIVYAFDIAAAGWALYNRNYPPIKCKSPLLMAAILVCTILWFVGDIQANGQVPLRGTPMANCRAFAVWIRIILGVCMASALIALRAYGLHRVFRQGRPFRGWGLYLPFLVYCMCMLAFGIVAQALPEEKSMYYIDAVDLCDASNGFRVAIFAILWVTWVVVACLSWRIRKIKSSFNESRESAMACLAVFAVLIFTTSMHYSLKWFPFRTVYRVLATSFDHLVINMFWWAIMGVPLFNCLFRKQQYLSMWVAKLTEDGLNQQYDVSSRETSKRSLSARRVRNSLLASVRATDLYYNDVDLHQLPLDAGYPLFDPAYDAHRPF
ncbi:hypothetical protein LPJ61_005268, partial [Coemansia biformis]